MQSGALLSVSFLLHPLPRLPLASTGCTQTSPNEGWAMWAYRTLPSCSGPSCWPTLRLTGSDLDKSAPWLTIARFLQSLLDIKIHVHGYHDITSFPPSPQRFPSIRLWSLSSIMKRSIEGQRYSIRSSGRVSQLDF